MKKYTLNSPANTRSTTLRVIAAALLGVAMIAASANNSTAQTVTIDQHGNLHAKPRVTALRDSTTGKTYTDAKGNVHPVYRGAKGTLYIGVVSKNGNYYRRYLKVENY
jgi:hypothetical protein